jgi:type III pantothenate kinase
MKLLVIDVGNTHTVLGVYEDARLLQHWRIQTEEGRTEDEYGVLIRSLLSGPESTGLSGAQWRAWCQR